MRRLVETLRERASSRVLLGVAGLWFLSTVVFDAPTTQFAATLAGSAITGVANLLADAYDLRDGIRTAGLGFATLFGAALLFILEEPVGVSGVLAVAGSWLVLDGFQSLRHAGLDAPPEEPPTGREVYRQYLSRRIRRLLREQPRSRSELRDAMDADDETVDSVLADLREGDLITVRAGVYHAATPSQPGAATRIGNALARSVRRLARPVAVEFRSDVGYGENGDDPPERGRESVGRPDEYEGRDADDLDERNEFERVE